MEGAKNMPADGISAQDVESAYELLLKRIPESGAITNAMKRFPNVHALYASIISSKEYQELSRKKLAEAAYTNPLPPKAWARERGAARRILLFGAYGNGNLGDAIQSYYVEKVVRRLLPDEKLELYSSSWIDLAEYPTQDAFIVEPGALLNPWFLAAMDFVVVGGGGLVSPAHYPLTDIGWLSFIERLGVPFGLLGIGVASSANSDPRIAAGFRRLASLAAFGSSRTASGVDQLKKACPDKDEAVVFPDPVLLSLAFKEGIDRRPTLRNGRKTFAFIIKSPSNPEQAKFNSAVLEFVGGRPETRIIAIEPRRDGKLSKQFPNIVMVSTEDQLRQAIGDADVLISSRFHGCILGIGYGLATFGVGEEKIRFLLRDLGNEAAYLSADHVVATCEALDQEGENFSYAGWDLSAIRAQFDAGAPYISNVMRKAFAGVKPA